MRLTRRAILGGAATGALAAAGIYELVDRLGGSSPRRPAADPFRVEQHVLDGVAVVVDNGVEVVVPPLHHQVVTAKLRVEEGPKALHEAEEALDSALARLEQLLDPTPAGLGITVAWGLPYFRRYVPALADEHIPVDRRASSSRRRPVRAVLDAIRFPSDPEETILEDNDVAVLLRSDDLAHVAVGSEAIFGELRELFEPTSIRKGFAGGGFAGRQSLPKKMALAAGIPGADLIPDTAELFLGFTSTQKEGLGPPKIANLETLGLTDAAGGYFQGGTAMHLSHLFEDLEAWYLNFDFAERVATSFRPELHVPPGTQTVRQGPQDDASVPAVKTAYRRSGSIGHSASIQTASRLDRDVVAEDGAIYPKGTAVPQRADFNTLDNPFVWSSRPERDGHSEKPAAGLHFVVFNPTSDDFNRNRLAMDGVLPDGTRLPFAPRARGQGFNAVLRTTHRQNFLVPPRRHRSFPLAELLR